MSSARDGIVRPAGFEPATCGLASPLRLAPPYSDCESWNWESDVPLRILDSSLHIRPFGGWTISSPSQARRVWPLRIPATAQSGPPVSSGSPAHRFDLRVSICEPPVAPAFGTIDIRNSPLAIGVGFPDTAPCSLHVLLLRADAPVSAGTVSADVTVKSAALSN